MWGENGVRYESIPDSPHVYGDEHIGWPPRGGLIHCPAYMCESKQVAADLSAAHLIYLVSVYNRM